MRCFLFFLILFTGLFVNSFGQTILIGKSKSSAAVWLKGDFRKLKYNIAQTDTSYMLTTADSSISKVSVYCTFNKKGDCISQKISFDCDSCYQKDLKLMLSRKNLEWSPIPSEKYLSKYAKHLLLIYNEKNRYYILKFIDINEAEYERLLTGKHLPAFAPALTER
ncbi:MAG: hypothetical protein ABIN91_22710 [Mucilaginibacter sp.]|uniref:hypothetical protein n=1 Tax=Mucilaginibacter sp. TaxID=1882438 RepID=UPI003265457E